MTAAVDNNAGNNPGDDPGHNTHDMAHNYRDIPRGDYSIQGCPGVQDYHSVLYQPGRCRMESRD